MKVKYNYYNKKEPYELYLCAPNRKKICAIHPDDTASCTIRLNSLSELQLVVQMNIQQSDGGYIKQPCYDLLESKRLVLVEDLGWFEITNVTENVDDDGQYKTVKCSSHEITFSSKGFICEERVYCFYNKDDPTDSQYNSNDQSAIPSIIGQLNAQLGIKVNLKADKEKDFKDWTITEISDSLIYYKNRDDNVCRSMEETSTTGYDFMVNNVEEAFEAIWLFDILHHTIQVKTIRDLTEQTDIYLSLRNLINTLEVTENADDIITVLNCEGTDLDIRTVNPMGTNYIVDFDYYKDASGKWMSQELIDTLDNWEKTYNENRDSFKNLVSKLKGKYVDLSNLQIQEQATKLRITDLITARDKLFVGSSLKAETVMNGDISKKTKTTFGSNLSSTCYKSEPSVKTIDDKTTFYYETDVSFQEATFETNYNGKYWYFTDDDGETYCKLIKDADGNLGYERYGVYENIKGWCDCEETGDVIVGVEQVNIGNKSLDTDSQFYETEFTKNNETKFVCYLEAPIYDSATEKFVGNGNTMENTLDICAEGNEDGQYLYLLDGDGTSYCKLELSSEVETTTDEETGETTQSAKYYVSGFIRYTVLENITKWIMLQEVYLSKVQTDIFAEEERIEEIQSEMQAISNKCHIRKYVANQANGEELLRELDCYWVEGDYSNDTLSVTDDTTMAEIISLAEELMEAGELQLERVSQPKFSFSIESIDFIKNSNFKKFAEQLDLGKKVYVEKEEGVIYRPVVTEIQFKLFSADDFKLTFSNSVRLDSNDFTFADLIAASAKTTKTLNSNWQDLIKYAKERESITNLILNPLDLTLRAAQNNMVNQEMIIDTHGLLGRKYSDLSQTTFDKEQIRIINNSILFTDDNWNTVKSALGKIYYEDNSETKTAYGLIAETLIGELIIGQTLKIKNENSSVTIDDAGIKIFNITTNATTGEKTISTVFDAGIDGSLILGNQESGNNYIEFDTNSLVIKSDNLKLDEDGNLTLKGIINATGGTIGGYTIGDTDLTSGGVGMSSATTEGNIAFWAGSSTNTQAPFYVTNQGYLKAVAGMIGRLDLSIGTTYGVIDSQLIKVGDFTFIGTDFVKIFESKDGYQGLYEAYLEIGGTDTMSKITPASIYTPQINISKPSGVEGKIVNSLGQYVFYELIPGKSYASISIDDNIISEEDETYYQTCRFMIRGDNEKTVNQYYKGYISADEIDCDTLTTEKITSDELNIGAVKIKNGSVQTNSKVVVFKCSRSGGWVSVKCYDSSGNNITCPTSYDIQVYTGCWFNGKKYLYTAHFDRGQSVSGKYVHDALGIDPSWQNFYENGETSITKTLYWTSGSNITFSGTVLPSASLTYALGSSSYMWSDIWVRDSAINGSDKNSKKNIKQFCEKHDVLFDNLSPVTYEFCNGTSGRTHFGLIAQDVKQAILEADLTTKEVATYCEWEDENNAQVTGCGLRYTELIPLNIYEIQKLKTRIKELEDKVNELTK